MARQLPSTQTRRTVLATGGLSIAVLLVPWTTGLTVALVAVVAIISLGILAITFGVLFSRSSDPSQRLQQLLQCLRTRITGDHTADKKPGDRDLEPGTRAHHDPPEPPTGPRHPHE